jgi:hypothetical protein
MKIDKKFEQGVTLRGHHVSIFADELLSQYSDTSEWGRGVLEDSMRNRVRRHRKDMDLLFDFLKTHPDTKITIVRGLDSICRSNCPAYDSLKCVQPVRGDADEDEVAIAEFGLHAGEPSYTSAQLMQIMNDYRERTGYSSPRVKAYHHAGYGLFINSFGERKEAGQ